MPLVRRRLSLLMCLGQLGEVDAPVAFYDSPTGRLSGRGVTLYLLIGDSSTEVPWTWVFLPEGGGALLEPGSGACGVAVAAVAAEDPMLPFRAWCIGLLDFFVPSAAAWKQSLEMSYKKMER